MDEAKLQALLDATLSIASELHGTLDGGQDMGQGVADLSFLTGLAVGLRSALGSLDLDITTVPDTVLHEVWKGAGLL